MVHLGQITRHKIKAKSQQSLLRACLGFLYGIQSSAVAMDTGSSLPVSRGRTDVVARSSQSCLWIRTEATPLHPQKCVPVERSREQNRKQGRKQKRTFSPFPGTSSHVPGLNQSWHQSPATAKWPHPTTKRGALPRGEVGASPKQMVAL